MKDMITQAKILNFEKLAKRDIESGIGFWISDYKPIDKIKVGANGKGGKDAKSRAVKADDGIYSFRYGTTTHEDKNAFKEKYTCECGKLTGTVFDGCRCSFCDTVVEFKDDNINITGWFKMENGAKIIHPIMYNAIISIIGKKDLMEMLLLPKLNANGAIIPSDKPYMNIGLIEFRNRFDEIINHYMEKKHKWNNKLDVYELIKEHRDKVFTSCLPVFSLLLRPVNIIGGVLEYNKINKDFTKLSSTICQINKIAFVEIEKIKLMRLLDIVQKTYHSIYKHCIEVMAKSKKALIRGQMLGAKFNYVARNVITPNNDKTRIDEVTMSYLGFLELHKPEIINIMTKTLGYSMTKAYNTWFEATLKFDDMIYEIMMSMIKNPLKPVKVLINRNPSIHFYSMMYCRVTNISKDYKSKTLEIHLNILAALAADFDGDVLNIVSVKDAELSKALEIFSPINMLLDRTNNNFNGLMNLIKDQIIVLNIFGKLGYEEKPKA